MVHLVTYSVLAAALSPLTTVYEPSCNPAAKEDIASTFIAVDMTLSHTDSDIKNDWRKHQEQRNPERISATRSHKQFDSRNLDPALHPLTQSASP